MTEAMDELKRSIASLEDNSLGLRYTSEESKAEMLSSLRDALAALERAPVEVPIPQPELTREYLIALCERAIVNVEKWSNRDTPSAQEKVGTAWALLKAGCEWHSAGDPKDDENTIWIEIDYPSFNSFEYDRTDPQYFDTHRVYLPTEKRLARRDGDWY